LIAILQALDAAKATQRVRLLFVSRMFRSG
jgi:hypothetical protein